MSADKNRITMWDRIMMAITFAEAGEAKMAGDILNQKSNEKQKESLLRKEEQRPELRV